ncbi:MAG: hypothetical protein AAB767_04860 [Patescibacteria group bacterium]
MHQFHAHKVGLVFGGILALWHAVWALMVLMGVAKPFLDYILGLHFLAFQYDVTLFTLGNAVMLVIVTGVIGYIIGCVFGWLWNYVHGAAHNG